MPWGWGTIATCGPDCILELSYRLPHFFDIEAPLSGAAGPGLDVAQGWRASLDSQVNATTWAGIHASKRAYIEACQQLPPAEGGLDSLGFCSASELFASTFQTSRSNWLIEREHTKQC